MTTSSWAQQAIQNFFASRRSPTQAQCDDIARTLSGAVALRPVDTPGSLSYTVICSSRPEHQPDLVVSFRELHSMIDINVVNRAKSIHGHLVPEATNHGLVKDADPRLAIYAMPCLRGVACLDALSLQINMSPNDEDKHVCFVYHLARYFARCWTNPEPIDTYARESSLAALRLRLNILAESPSCQLPKSAIDELEHSLPMLLGQDWPQVLTHGDLSITNILIDEETYEITGIVDWSMAKTMPFGMDLDFLFAVMGFRNLRGWHDYACRPRLHKAFWDSFWSNARVENGLSSDMVCSIAETAAKLSAVLRYCFQRNADGTSSEVVSASNEGVIYLKAWFSY